MSQSGQHSNDYMDFVETGLQKANAKSTIGTFPAYYFCLKADMVPEFDTESGNLTVGVEEIRIRTKK